MGTRTGNRLSALMVARLKEPGRYADGLGLHLQITKAGVKSWIFRYERDGLERAMGLGPLHTVGLAAAREAAREARELLRKKHDPIEARDAAHAERAAAVRREITFDQATEGFIAKQELEWKNAKHRQQWVNTLATYASPVLGKMKVSRIDTPDVMKVLEPIWVSKTETATRVRARIEAVLRWATSAEYRKGENPARWKGGPLAELLADPEKLKKEQNHPALPYNAIRPFCAALRTQPGQAARALELTILTAGRTSEVLKAQWSEFDLGARIWVLPKERMKAKKQHRVPLSARAVEIIKAQAGLDSRYVFPGAKEGTPLSNMAMLVLLKRMGRSDITVHGFRSTFTDWAAETTNTQNFIVEMALAHVVKSKVEAAYRRGDLLAKRRKLMNDWAAACA